ncbi:MAG: hypothetical protein D6786_09705 [Gammaproteobacteria bacterium]|nr:MAG: hypothetical protein D6786_09705 [Gammaproteobacteria bacterium]
MQWRRPVSRLELVLALGLIALLIGFALQRLGDLAVEAERIRLELSVRNMETGLRHHVAARILEGRLQELAAEEGANPVGRIVMPPPAYLGELDHPDWKKIKGGSWYYDKQDRVLVYRVVNEDRFVSPLPGRATFRLRVEYLDANGNGRRDPDERVEGLRLERVAPYRWLDS